MYKAYGDMACKTYFRPLLTDQYIYIIDPTSNLLGIFLFKGNWYLTHKAYKLSLEKYGDKIGQLPISGSNFVKRSDGKKGSIFLYVLIGTLLATSAEATPISSFYFKIILLILLLLGTIMAWFLYKGYKKRKIEQLLGDRLCQFPIVKIKLQMESNARSALYMKLTRRGLITTYVVVMLLIFFFFSKNYGSIITVLSSLVFFWIQTDYFTIHAIFPIVKEVMVSD